MGVFYNNQLIEFLSIIFSPKAEAEGSLAITDMKDLLGLHVIGVIPKSRDVLTCTNLGTPIISLGEDNNAACAYMNMVVSLLMCQFLNKKCFYFAVSV